jgi:hypothetical protein
LQLLKDTYKDAHWLFNNYFFVSILAPTATESVLQKFRKTFSLRFHQKKASRDSCTSDIGEALSEILGEPSEEESLSHAPSASTTADSKDEQPEQKSR